MKMMGEDEKDGTRVNPSEGRVPVSWNECADWLEAGQVVWFSHGDESYPVTNHLTAADFRRFQQTVTRTDPIGRYRLLPPPGLVPAPEGMDGGGWLGQGKDVPDGWEWRCSVIGLTPNWVAPGVQPHPADVVQCRPPVAHEAPEPSGPTVTAEAAGAVPDDVIEEVARHLASVWGEVLPDADDWSAALGIFSVPSVAEVFARDAKVREILAKVDRGVIGEHPCAGPCVGCGAGPDESCHGDCRCDNGEDCWPAVLIEADRELLRRIAALYPEAGK